MNPPHAGVEVVVAPGSIGLTRGDQVRAGGTTGDLIAVDVVRLPLAWLNIRVERRAVSITARPGADLHLHAGRRPFDAVRASADGHLIQGAIVEAETEHARDAGDIDAFDLGLGRPTPVAP